jgi:hypothetical protein
MLRHLADIHNTPFPNTNSLLRCSLYLNVAHCILTLLTVSLNYFWSLCASHFLSSRKVIIINILLTRACVERIMLIGYGHSMLKSGSIMSKSNLSHIEQFNGTNFKLWKYNCWLVLEQHELLDIVEVTLI